MLSQESPEAIIPPTTHGQFVSKQDKKFNTIIPYGYPLPPDTEIPKEIRENTFNSINTIDPFLRKNIHNSVLSNFDTIYYSNKLSEDILNKSKKCRNSNLDKLISSENRNSFMRCGWIYSPPENENIPTPVVSQGFLGTADGPFKFLNPPPPSGQWFWNLEDAKKQILTDRCKALRVCSDIEKIVDGEKVYESCSYCGVKEHGVPAVNNRLLYPNERALSCNGPLYSNNSQCQQLQQQELLQQQQNQNVQITANGTLPNGTVPKSCDIINNRMFNGRQCILDVINNGGCSSNGLLYQAISNATTDNLISSIENSISLREYQNRSNAPLNLDIFRQGNATSKTIFQSEIQALSSNSNKPKTEPSSALGAAARDLCVRRGAIDEWDPCQDIPDTTTSPFNIHLNCLQKNFRKLGGQPAGLDYPTSQTLNTIYNLLPTYGDVKLYWEKLLENTKSNTYQIQKQAMNKFYGIQTLIGDIPTENYGRVRINFGNVGDIGFPHIIFGIASDLLFIKEAAINDSINQEIDRGLNANILYNNIKKGRKYNVEVLNEIGKKVNVKITDVIDIVNNNNGIRYALAFKVDKDINALLDNPSRISVIIL